MKKISSVQKRDRDKPKSKEDSENDPSLAYIKGRIKKRKKLTEFERGWLDGLLNTSLSQTQIAKELECSKQTVSVWAKRSEEAPKKKGKAEERRGRPQITTPREERLLKIRATAADEPSLRTLAEETKKENPKRPLSKDTIGRRLHSLGVNPHRKIPKPRLTREQKAHRLRWAKEHQDWTVDQWERVLWSDESPFTIIPKIPRKYVWIPDDKIGRGRTAKLSDKRVAPKVRSGGGKINVWGCFCGGGVGHLKEITGNMDAKQYHQILVHHVIPLIKQKTQTEPSTIAWVFQQDNCSTHTAKTNVEYLSRKARESGCSWSLMEWPSNTPDLNPIENIWAFLKAQLRKYPRPPASKGELFQRLQTEWDKLGPNALRNYVADMPDRIAAVIANRGGSTKW